MYNIVPRQKLVDLNCKKNIMIDNENLKVSVAVFIHNQIHNHIHGSLDFIILHFFHNLDAILRSHQTN